MSTTDRPHQIPAASELSLGERVRAHRRRRGRSQATLAQLIGRSERWMVAVERGDDDLRLSDITQLATALGVDIAQLSGVHVRSSTSTDSSTANHRPPLPGINTL